MDRCEGVRILASGVMHDVFGIRNVTHPIRRCRLRSVANRHASVKPAGFRTVVLDAPSNGASGLQATPGVAWSWSRRVLIDAVQARTTQQGRDGAAGGRCRSRKAAIDAGSGQARALDGVMSCAVLNLGSGAPQSAGQGSLQQSTLRPSLCAGRGLGSAARRDLRGRRVRLCADGSFAGHARKSVIDGLPSKASTAERCAEGTARTGNVHLVLVVLPDSIRQLSDQEIVERWLRLYPSRTEERVEERRAEMLADPARIVELRNRLGSLSWFMRVVCR